MNRMVTGHRRSASGVTLVVLLLAALVPVSAIPLQKRASQTAKRAPQQQSPFAQGYQKGYGEGFTQGAADWSNNQARDFRRSDRWQSRDGGSSEEYRQGYELGFELAYSDGYFGRARNTTVPRNAEVLAKAAALADQQRAVQDRVDQNRDPDRAETNRSQGEVTRPRTSAPFSVPSGTELRIRLSTPISTKTGRVGDVFKATVVSPSSYESATVEGHIATLNKSGRVSGKTEVGLAFDTLRLPDGRNTRIEAELVKVYESESVKKVDEEGNVETGSRTRESEVRGGVGAAVGAIIGGIVGGGKGAVIGLILGGAAGVGSVYVEGNKDLILDAGTEMVIRSLGSRER